MRTERRESPGRVRRASPCLLLALSLLRPGVARAEPVSEEQDLELGLSYHAPRACPSGSRFLESLREHLAAGEGPVDADVNIVWRPVSHDFELRLQLRVAGRLFDSVERSSSCDTLMRLAALNTGIARTKATLHTPLTVPEPSLAPAMPEPAAAEALAPGDAGSSFGDESSALGAIEAPLAASPAGVADTGAATDVGAAPSATPLNGFALLGVRSANALLPQLAWGPSAVLGAALPPFSLRLTGTWWTPQRSQRNVDAGSPLELRLEQASLELAPCWSRALAPRLRVDGCALLGGHRIQTGEGETRVFGTLGVAALVSVGLWQGLRLELEAGLQATPLRPQLHSGGLLRVYRPEVLQPLAQLALGWEFGPRAQEAAQ